MPRSVPFDAARDSLQKLIDEIVPGEGLVLTSQEESVAIVTKISRTIYPCQPGSAKDTDYWMAPDFDAPVEDIKDYME